MDRERRSWLMDMDGVIVREDHLVPGADRLVARLAETNHPFLILTNNSIYTPRDLAARLGRLGLAVTPNAIWTSALATAKFLDDQRPGGTAFVIGEAGLTTALYEVGYTLSETDPDYVVLGETRRPRIRRIGLAICRAALSRRWPTSSTRSSRSHDLPVCTGAQTTGR